MKIGKHIGKRAIYNNQEGYFFETMIHKQSNLFVFDEDRFGHSAPSYFRNHEDEWNDNLKERCLYVSTEDVKFIKKVLV